MKSLVIFDSVHGNTEKIAMAIGRRLEAEGELQVAKINEIDPQSLDEYNLVVVGSPTHAGRPTPATKEFLNKIPDNGLKGIEVTAFDTGIPAEGKKFFMRLFLKILGYAAPRIAKSLEKKGGVLVFPPKGFFVVDREGPLQPGEEEKAATWASGILETM